MQNPRYLERNNVKQNGNLSLVALCILSGVSVLTFGNRQRGLTATGVKHAQLFTHWKKKSSRVVVLAIARCVCEKKTAIVVTGCGILFFNERMNNCGWPLCDKSAVYNEKSTLGKYNSVGYLISGIWANCILQTKMPNHYKPHPCDNVWGEDIGMLVMTDVPNCVCWGIAVCTF